MARPKKKQPRRKPGTGGVRFKPGRQRPYEAEYPIKGSTPRYESFTTRQAAIDWLDSLVAEQASATPRDLEGASLSFADFMDEWLTIKEPTINKKTFDGYNYLTELAIGEETGLGTRRIDSFRRIDFDRMFNHFASKGFKGVRQMRGVLTQAFDYAVDNEYIKRNPIKKVKLPKVEHRDIVILTEAQRQHVLHLALEEHDSAVPLAPLWHFYSRLGWRKGEGAALMWADIDWEAKIVTLRRSRTNVGNETIQGTPKNKKPRIAPLPDDVIALLKEHKDAQARRAAIDPRWKVTGYVFTDAHGDPVALKHIQYRWEELRKRAGVQDCTIHGLRHTALYLLEQAGMTESARMALAGHSTAAMQRHYTNHATVEDIRRQMK